MSAQMGDTRLPVKFWNQVKPEPRTGCWLWVGRSITGGYGAFKSHGSSSAHRAAYQALVGPIPRGLEVDHLCRVRHCVNPCHMELVTHAENIRRSPVIMSAFEERNARERVKTHCRNGHPLGGDNLYAAPSGRRVCRTCTRASQRAFEAANREKRNERSARDRAANPELHRARCRASYHKKAALLKALQEKK